MAPSFMNEPRFNKNPGTRVVRGLAGYPFVGQRPMKYLNANSEFIDLKNMARGRVLAAGQAQRAVGVAAQEAEVAGRLSTRFFGSKGVGLWNLNKSVMRTNIRMMGAGYRAANAVSKTLLHASIPQVAAAGALVGAGLYGLHALTPLDPNDPSKHILNLDNVASGIHQFMKQSSRPSYGYSQMGQSTQGLVFGLHSRRTA